VLVHSIRKKNKVMKRTKYVGKSLPPQEKLEQLKESFLKELSEQRYKYLSGDDVEKIENKKNNYNNELEQLSPTEKNKQLNDFMIRFTYDSSKLSGVDVTLRQTLLILKDGIIPKDFKNLKTAKELENHKAGIVAITKYKGKLDVRFLKKLHKILLSGVEDSIAGVLRSEFKRDVKIAGTVYVPPKWQALDKEIENFFKWYRSENRKIHPLELAALIHLKLISIQLFADGNSRLARLLMNWVLWKKNYPLIDIPVEDLENYYDVLDKYQIEHRTGPFVTYIKKKFLED